MKKMLNQRILILVFLVASLALSGCVAPQNKEAEEQKAADEKKIEELTDELKDLKEGMEEMKAQQEKADAEAKEAKEKEEKVESEPVAADPKKTTPETKKPKTSTYTGPSYVKINTPEPEAVFHEAPVRFTGTVSPDTIKVTVKATSPTSPKVDDYVLQNYKPGSTTFNYGASHDWNNLTEGTNTYIFTAHFQDGTSSSSSQTVYFTPGGAEMGKPVIYLYPTEETKLFVNVKPTNGITISDPEINDGWNVIATPNSDITNLADNKTYPYLFWEGYAADFVTPEEGFVVGRDEVPGLFDEKLSYMGLNEKEIADFKEFWVPILSEKPYYFITFIDQESIDRYAPLTIEPKPDSIIRVFFDYKALDEKIEVKPQELKRGERNGFTATEWGGRLYR